MLTHLICEIQSELDLINVFTLAKIYSFSFLFSSRPYKKCTSSLMWLIILIFFFWVVFNFTFLSPEALFWAMHSGISLWTMSSRSVQNLIVSQDRNCDFCLFWHLKSMIFCRLYMGINHALDISSLFSFKLTKEHYLFIFQFIWYLHL